MTVLVVLETVAVGLLAVLVAGLLRSHAEILRRLHELGAGYGEEAGPGSRRSTGAGVPITLGRPGVAAAIVGRSPAGDAVSVAPGRPGERTLLLFLSSGCHRCGQWLEALRTGGHEGTGARVVVVGRDADEESPAVLAGLVPPEVTVVLSSRAWDDYHVPGSPYAFHIGDEGTIIGEGTAATWEQLLSLLVQATSDAASTRSGPEREGRADAELAAAGILPGDPSLYPPVPR